MGLILVLTVPKNCEQNDRNENDSYEWDLWKNNQNWWECGCNIVEKNIGLPWIVIGNLCNISRTVINKLTSKFWCPFVSFWYFIIQPRIWKILLRLNHRNNDIFVSKVFIKIHFIHDYILIKLFWKSFWFLYTSKCKIESPYK